MSKENATNSLKKKVIDYKILTKYILKKLKYEVVINNLFIKIF